jgi:hypothetical protein
MPSRTDTGAEKALIEKVVSNSIGWALNKDKDLLYSCFAQDKDLFWFSPEANGTIHGFDNFTDLVENVFMSETFKAVGYEIRDMKINLSNSGEVAWYSCILDDRNIFSGQSAEWLNTRWTGVLERRNGNWLIVQMHFSFAVDSQK